MKRNRQDRNKDFDTFYDKSKGIFRNLQQSDRRTEKFEREHMLCVCPGSRNGGTDKRVVEVFWGSKIFETETQGRHWKSLTEQGSTLFFYRFIEMIQDMLLSHCILHTLILENRLKILLHYIVG